MAASKCIGPTEGLRPLVFSNLIGLLYSAGLRIGEALKLTIGDVDLKTLDEDIADRDKEDTDQRRYAHSKNDCGAHDAARGGTRTTREH